MNKQAPTSPQVRWWTFALVCLALFMAMLDNLVVTTALPSIRRALGASVSDLEWTVNAYTLAFATLMLTGAALGERFGRKRIFIAGVSIFTAGSAFAALSNSAVLLELARATQGLGAALLTPLTLTILIRVFPSEQRAAAIGLWSGVSGLGLAIGPLVGGAIINGLAWNAIFWVNVPIGVAVVVLAVLRLEESRGDQQPLDVPGLTLAAGGLFALTFGLVRGNTLGWTSATILGAFGVAAILLTLFVRRERSVASPVLDMTLFRSQGFSIANATGFLMSAGMFGSIFFLTLYLQDVLGNSPLQAGIRTMPWTGTIMVVAPIAGIMAGRIGARPLVAVGMALQAFALVWIAHVAGTATPYLDLLPAFVAGGVGMGLTFAPLSEAVMGAVAGNRQGEASGAYNSIRELGGVFGVAVLGAVFQHLVTSPAHFMNGLHWALWIGAIVVGAGAFLSILLPSPSAQTAAVPEMAIA